MSEFARVKAIDPESAPPLPDGIVPSLLSEELSSLLAYIDSQHRYRLLNRAYEAFFGRSRNELLGKTILELTGEAYYRQAEPYIRRALNGERVSFVSSLRHADGKLREVEVWYSPHVSVDGQVRGFVSLIHDVSERKFESETRARLAAIVDSSDDAIVSKTLDGTITSWNGAAEKIFGYTAAEAIGQHITLIIPLERRTEEDEVLARLRQGLKIDHFETERRTKDGRTVFISLSVSPIRNAHGEIVGASKVARDITQRKRDQEALSASNEYRRAVLESMPECVKVLDRQGNVLNMNPAGLRMVEADSPEEILGKCVYPLIQEQDREAFRAVNENVFHGGSGGRLEFAVRGLKGTGRIFESNVVPLRGAGSEVIGALSVTHDITSRKQAELRDAFLVRMDDATRALSDPKDLMETVARLLGEHLGVERCTYAEIDTDSETYTVIGNYARNVASIVGQYPLARFGEDLIRHFQSGTPYVFEDAVRTPGIPSAYREMGVSAAVVAPLVKAGRLAASMSVHSAEPRRWRPDEVDLVRLVANRCWESMERARIERTLRESEQQFRTLANAIPNLAWMAHPDGHIFWYNRRWYDYTGTTQEEMEGWGWQKVHDPEMLPSVLERWRASIAGGDVFEMVFPLRGADGRFRLFLTQVEPVKDGRGRVVRWFGTNTDITGQQEAEAREKKARETAELLNRIGPLLAAELDPRKLTQKITDIATEATGAQVGAFFHAHGDAGGESYVLYTLSGGPREALANFPMARNTDVFGPTFRGEGAVRSADITKDPRYATNAPYQGSPEGHLPVRSYLAVPVKSRTGHVLGGLFFGHAEAGIFNEDAETIVTGIAAQAAIALDNASLFDETRRTSEALYRSNEDLKRVNSDLNQFAYSASHDLREPMRMVSVYTQFLSRKLRGTLDEEGEAFIGHVLRGAGRMEALLRDLLAYTQAAETLDAEPALTDANEALNRALSNLATSIDESGARIVSSSLPKVRIAEVHLTQILQNLIGNAIKYRSEDTPEITVGAALSGREAEFFVTDNGIGIEEQYLEQVFGIFKRLHTNERYSGTGIGLAICQRIVQRAGGRIWVRSKTGQGSTFFFTLPAEA